MQGTIFDVKRFAIHDGPGIRTTVFFKGCPLNCTWCHNPESRCRDIETLVSGKTVGWSIAESRVMDVITRDLVYYEESGGGVTFSGGEPLLQPDFLEALLDRCRSLHLHTAIDTSGHVSREIIERIAPKADLFLYDLKLMNDELHRQYVGVSNDLIHANLKRLAELGAEIVIRIPLIPDITDTETNLKAILEFLSPLPKVRRVDLLPYNSMHEDKMKRFGYKRETVHRARQTDEQIAEITARLKADEFDIRIGG